ncbi:MAG: hypothetical protein ACRCTI_06960, partial [Beijerinckiaceae bacterium]
AWRTSIAALRITRAADDCPSAFDQSYTRWREQAADIPVLFDGRRDPERPDIPATAIIISEHFGGASPETADHMERFWLGQGLGLLRWERWEHGERSRRPNLDRRAGELSSSGRCPEITGSAAPSDGWQRIDCRMWTNFVSSTESASGFDWAAAKGGMR